MFQDFTATILSFFLLKTTNPQPAKQQRYPDTETTEEKSPRASKVVSVVDITPQEALGIDGGFLPVGFVS